MKRQLVAVALTLSMLGVGTVSASATTKNPHATYALGKAKHCRVNFVKRTERHKVKGHKRRYVACVFVAPQPPRTVAALPSTINYVAHVDPTFVQSPTNPLAVTYTYGADATVQQGAVTTDLDSVGQLPAGILNLYSDGLLACSMSVGTNANTGLCPVTYSATGPHTVVTIYQSGTISTTETDTEMINPFSTTISESYFTSGYSSLSGWWPERVTATVTDQSGDAIPSPVTLTVTDTTKGVVATTFSSPTGVCSFDLFDSGSGHIAFENLVGCSGGGSDSPVGDSYVVTASYAGTTGYLASQSQPLAINS